MFDICYYFPFKICDFPPGEKKKSGCSLFDLVSSHLPHQACLPSSQEISSYLMVSHLISWDPIQSHFTSSPTLYDLILSVLLSSFLLWADLILSVFSLILFQVISSHLISCWNPYHDTALEWLIEITPIPNNKRNLQPTRRRPFFKVEFKMIQ